AGWVFIFKENHGLLDDFGPDEDNIKYVFNQETGKVDIERYGELANRSGTWTSTHELVPNKFLAYTATDDLIGDEYWKTLVTFPSYRIDPAGDGEQRLETPNLVRFATPAPGVADADGIMVGKVVQEISYMPLDGGNSSLGVFDASWINAEGTFMSLPLHYPNHE
ncbi:hypothetical protein OAI84_00220, partial [bacterium]|nr:hypothetical protein [bacterium]